MDVKAKVEELAAIANLGELLHGKDEEDKKSKLVIWILAGIGVAVVIGVIAYLIYRYLSPAYEDDFYDFDDDFDDLEDNLDDVKEEIKEVKEELNDVREELNETKEELSEAKEQLSEAKEEA